MFRTFFAIICISEIALLFSILNDTLGFGILIYWPGKNKLGNIFYYAEDSLNTVGNIYSL